MNSSRAEPRHFGRLLQDMVGVESIVNRVVVHNELKNQIKWFEETHEKYEIENMIIVGGESSKIKYIGPTVNQILELVAFKYNNNGGDIYVEDNLPTRLNESKNLIRKSENGAEFLQLRYFAIPKIL